MQRPHVYQRSAPRAARRSFAEPANEAVTARLISAQLGTMIDKADGAGLAALGDHLEAARIEAERVVAGSTRSADPRP